MAFLGLFAQWEVTDKVLHKMMEEREQDAALVASSAALKAKLEAKEQRLSASAAEAWAQVEDLAAAEAKLKDERKTHCLQILDLKQRVRYLEAAAQTTTPGPGTHPGNAEKLKGLQDALTAAELSIAGLQQDLLETKVANDNGRKINEELEQRLQTSVGERDAAIGALREEVATLTVSQPSEASEAIEEAIKELDDEVA
jgi:hypothetical protein